MRMRLITWEQALSHGNETCHMRMRLVTWELDLSHGNETCHLGKSLPYRMRMSLFYLL